MPSLFTCKVKLPEPPPVVCPHGQQSPPHHSAPHQVAEVIQAERYIEVTRCADAPANPACVAASLILTCGRNGEPVARSLSPPVNDWLSSIAQHGAAQRATGTIQSERQTSNYRVPECHAPDPPIHFPPL